MIYHDRVIRFCRKSLKLISFAWPFTFALCVSCLQAEMTSIVLKKDVTMLDIQSTRMLGQVGFLAKVWKLNLSY